MIATVSIVLACAKENIQNDATPEKAQDAKGNISFVVDVESASDVKATISASDNFTWEASDRAAVFTSEGHKVVLTPSDISGGVATFTGEVTSGETVPEGAIVVYPADFLTAANTVTFPAEYTSNGQGTVLAAKVASGRKLTFKYLAATLKATITDVPSIASSITVTSTQTLTGAHTINFTGSTPTLSTSSTAKEITFSSPANGNNELVIPVPTTGAAQTFTYKVNYSSNVLFTQSTTKTLERNSYMSMASLTINPSVYLLSSMTGWGEDDSKRLLMSVSSGVASSTLNALKNQYFRVCIKYPACEDMIEMGPASSITENSENGDMNTDVSDWVEKPSVLVKDAIGKYSITYNYTTGRYGIATLETSPSIYAVGAQNSWNISNTDTPLVKAGKWYYVLGYNGIYKINYSGYQTNKWFGVFGYNGSSATGAPGIEGADFGSSDSNSDWYYSSVLYDSENNLYYYWAEGKDNVQSFAQLYLKGSWDSFSIGVPMTRSSSNTHIWTITRTFAANQTFKVTDGADAWWGFSNNMESIYDNTVQAESADNLKITVAGTYLIMFNEKTNKYHIVKTD